MLRLSAVGITSLPCYPRQTVASAGTDMPAIHALADHLHKGAQLDIEDDGSGTPDPHGPYYVLFPNHARVTLLQGSHGWHPRLDRGSRAALRLTRDARLALQAEPGP